ncbi:MAG TPA: STAS domain-containing protein, partial [Pirellula sp.]|nr:STAS domain-containing protein [Pirellula sp.]
TKPSVRNNPRNPPRNNPNKPSNCLFAPKKLRANNSEVLRLELLEAFAHEPAYTEVVLDLSKTEDLDAIGLALLHSAVRFAEKNSRELKLRHASPMVNRVLCAVGIAPAVSQVEGPG